MLECDILVFLGQTEVLVWADVKRGVFYFAAGLHSQVEILACEALFVSGLVSDFFVFDHARIVLCIPGAG